MKQYLGALKPKVDVRDFKVAAGACEFPESYLCENLPPVKNQQSVCSCVAHAAAAILETFNKNETGKFVPLSTDFIYGMQGIEFGRRDKGMYLRDACKIVQNYGDPSEHSIGGNTEQPECTEKLINKLNNQISAEALTYKIKSYAKCNTEEDIKHALMTYGPVLGSIKWYNKCIIKNKVVNFDKTSKYGYHGIAIYGWNEKGWICQNSWGRTWNGDGRFILPYTDEFVEAWSFVDAANEDIHIPKNNKLLNYIYKFINLIINLFKR